MNKVCVLGSLNMDIVVKVNNMPKVGQTIIGDDLVNVPGGKGANQAVAARRAGSEVYMLGKVGKDDNGYRLVKELANDGISVEYVFQDEQRITGTAIITVNDEGDNSIIVIPGANMGISEEELEKTKEVIKDSDVLVAQFETSIDKTIEAFKFAKQCGVTTILNPAPAKEIPQELLKYTDIIVPNETEALELTKVKVVDLESAHKAGEMLLNQGVKYVIITMGEKGAAIISHEACDMVPAYKVEAIDTTAAGDSFIGALSSKLNSKDLHYENLKSAIAFGNKVSSIAVQRKGAQPSIPTLEEVLKIYGEE